MTDANTESTLMARLKQLEERRAEFSATVNHNLKTPLNGIIGFSSVLLAEANNLEPEQHHQLRLVYESARQLLERIDALLVLERMESGKIKPSREWFTPGDLLIELASNFFEAANRNSMSIKIDIESAPQKLLCDINLIRRSIQEILDNSIRFGTHGTSCTIGTSIDENEKNNTLQVKFFVTNSGGVATDQREKLLRSLDSKVDYLDTRFDGLGLGLALARQSAICLGGYIEPKMDDELTTFSLVLVKNKEEIELQ